MKSDQYLRKLVALFEKNKHLQKDLLKLFEDPKNKEKYEKALGLLRPLLRVFTKLLRLSTRELEAFVAIVEFVVVVSLYLKRNVLDNPEVQLFIRDKMGKGQNAAKRFLTAVSELIDVFLRKMRRVRPSS